MDPSDLPPIDLTPQTTTSPTTTTTTSDVTSTASSTSSTPDTTNTSQSAQPNNTSSQADIVNGITNTTPDSNTSGQTNTNVTGQETTTPSVSDINSSNQNTTPETTQNGSNTNGQQSSTSENGNDSTTSNTSSQQSSTSSTPQQTTDTTNTSQQQQPTDTAQSQTSNNNTVEQQPLPDPAIDTIVQQPIATPSVTNQTMLASAVSVSGVKQLDIGTFLLIIIGALLAIGIIFFIGSRIERCLNRNNQKIKDLKQEDDEMGMTGDEKNQKKQLIVQPSSSDGKLLYVVKDGKFTLVENNLEITQTRIDDSMTRFKIDNSPTKEIDNKTNTEMQIVKVTNDSPPKALSQMQVRNDSPQKVTSQKFIPYDSPQKTSEQQLTPAGKVMSESTSYQKKTKSLDFEGSVVEVSIVFSKKSQNSKNISPDRKTEKSASTKNLPIPEPQKASYKQQLNTGSNKSLNNISQKSKRDQVQVEPTTTSDTPMYESTSAAQSAAVDIIEQSPLPIPETDYNSVMRYVNQTNAQQLQGHIYLNNYNKQPTMKKISQDQQIREKALSLQRVYQNKSLLSVQASQTLALKKENSQKNVGSPMKGSGEKQKIFKVPEKLYRDESNFQDNNNSQVTELGPSMLTLGESQTPTKVVQMDSVSGQNDVLRKTAKLRNSREMTAEIFDKIENARTLDPDGEVITDGNYLI